MYLCRSSSNVLRMPSFIKCFKIHRFPLRLPHKMMLERPTVVRTCGVLTILRLKRASRQSCVRFFNFLLPKRGLNLKCFWRRHALFEHLNFQECSDTQVFCSFWRPNVLCTTIACALSRSHRPKVIRDHGVFELLVSKLASRHSGVHFLISHRLDASAPAALASFVSRLFYLFARLDLLSSDSFSSLLLLPLFSHHCNCICP